MRGSGSGAQKACGISLLADAQHLTRKDPEQPGLMLNLSLPEQWVGLDILQRFLPELIILCMDTSFERFYCLRE